MQNHILTTQELFAPGHTPRMGASVRDMSTPGRSGGDQGHHP